MLMSSPNTSLFGFAILGLIVLYNGYALYMTGKPALDMSTVISALTAAGLIAARDSNK